MCGACVWSVCVVECVSCGCVKFAMYMLSECVMSVWSVCVVLCVW